MIETFIAALYYHLSVEYSGVDVRIDYDALQSKHPMPAICIETTGGAVVPDRGTGELFVDCQFAAHVLGNFKTYGEELTRGLAFDLARALHRYHVISGSDSITVLNVVRDEFSSDADEVSVWRVEFSSVLRFGENAFDYSLFLAPDTILASTSPEIGIPHEQDYNEIVSP